MAFTKVTNAGIGSTNTVLLHNLNVVGTVTATDGIFSGIGSFGGNVSIGGVLTYEDVTNVDSVGLITARNGITVLGAGVTIAAGGLNVNAGVSTFGGIVNIGGASVSQTRELNIGSNAEADIAIETHNDSITESSNIRFYKSGNTGASPQVVETNDNIARLIAYGYDGTDYANAACMIEMSVDGAPGSNDMPGKITLSTNAGGTSVTDRLTINSSGNIGQSVTPSGWASAQAGDFYAYQIGTGMALFGRGSGDEDRGGISCNYYNTGSAQKYIGNGHAGRIYFEDGSIVFSNTGSTANSAGADAALTLYNRLQITAAGKVSIGELATPDSLLHIHNGTAGSIAATSYANLTIESSDTTANTLQFLSPATAAQQIRFGDAADNGSGWIQYNHANNALSFGANGPERARIDSDGRFLISHSTSHGDMYSKLQVCDTSSSGSIDLGRYTANAHPPYLNFFKSRSGTINGNTIVQDGDKLGYITFSGNDGSGFHEAASIHAQVDGDPSDGTDMPGKLVFNTVPDGSTTSTERMTIDRNGKILLGTTRSQYTNDYYDDITINNSGGSGDTGGCGITMISDAASWGAIQFGDDDDDDRAYIKYNHNDDTMRMSAGGADQQIIGSNVIDYFQNRTIYQIAGSQVAIADGASKTFTITGLSYGWANVILGFYGEGHYCGVEISLGGLMAGGSTYYNSSIKMNVSSGDVTVSTAKNQTSYVITIANSVGNGGSIHGNSLFTGGGINSSHPAGAWS